MPAYLQVLTGSGIGLRTSLKNFLIKFRLLVKDDATCATNERYNEGSNNNISVA